ncbi:MAG: helicase HerA-like domain-containing protein [Alphaproteobacteria bacterium]
MNPDRPGAIFIGKGEKSEYLALALANRHGLVAGATGTGKTLLGARRAFRLGQRLRLLCRRRQRRSFRHQCGGKRQPAFAERAKIMGLDYEVDRFRSSSGICSALKASHPRHGLGDGPLLIARACSI